MNSTTTSSKRVMVYDATQKGWKDKQLSAFWWAGSFLGNFDVVIAATSWDDAVEKLTAIEGTISQLQIWGHGSSGKMWIDNVSLSLDKDDKELMDSFVAALSEKLTWSSVVWFRACDVFRAAAGKLFANTVSTRLRCGVVGHTCVISSPFPTHQSGGHGIRAPQKAEWSTAEGGGSFPWKTNTCLVTDMNPPESWWK